MSHRNARLKARLALGPPPPHPFMGGRPRNTHLSSDMGDGAAGRDTFDQQTPPEDRLVDRSSRPLTPPHRTPGAIEARGERQQLDLDARSRTFGATSGGGLPSVLAVLVDGDCGNAQPDGHPVDPGIQVLRHRALCRTLRESDADHGLEQWRHQASVGLVIPLKQIGRVHRPLHEWQLVDVRKHGTQQTGKVRAFSMTTHQETDQISPLLHSERFSWTDLPRRVRELVPVRAPGRKPNRAGVHHVLPDDVYQLRHASAHPGSERKQPVTVGGLPGRLPAEFRGQPRLTHAHGVTAGEKLFQSEQQLLTPLHRRGYG